MTTAKFVFTLKSAHPFRTTSIQLANFVELLTLIRIIKCAESIARFPEIYNPVSHEYGEVKTVSDHVLRVLRAIDDIPCAQTMRTKNDLRVFLYNTYY